MITEYNRINSKLARANSEFKIERVENKFCHRTRNNASMKCFKKEFNRAQRAYDKSVVRLAMNGVI
tara:strand:- start:1366 stop:1563 length:198 start_codon:yes stop_codon:yes gene_type:complete